MDTSLAKINTCHCACLKESYNKVQACTENFNLVKSKIQDLKSEKGLLTDADFIQKMIESKSEKRAAKIELLEKQVEFLNLNVNNHACSVTKINVFLDSNEIIMDFKDNVKNKHHEAVCSYVKARTNVIALLKKTDVKKVNGEGNERVNREGNERVNADDEKIRYLIKFKENLDLKQSIDVAHINSKYARNSHNDLIEMIENIEKIETIRNKKLNIPSDMAFNKMDHHCCTFLDN